MKIQIKKLILIIFLVVQLFSGILPEAIMLVCLFYMIFTQYNWNKNILGKKLYFSCIICITLFIGLFFVQTRISSDLNFVRLYGLTKCIIAPALMLISFTSLADDFNTITYLMFFSVIINIVYIANLFLTGFTYTSGFVFGSYNGCSTVDVIMLPCVLNYRDICTANRNHKMIAFINIYLSVIVFLIVFSSSVTAYVIFAMQLITLFVSKIRTHKFLIRIVKPFILVGMVFLACFSWMIGTGYIATNGSELATRAGIWVRTYLTFERLDGIHKMFGMGNDIISTMTKTMEPHNFFMEILLIYGVVGVIIFLFYFIRIVQYVVRRKASNQLYFIMAFVSYLLTSMIHPFYTGMYLNQIVCVLSLLCVALSSDNKYIKCVKGKWGK